MRDTIRINWRMKWGVPGTDHDEANPLNRAIRRLFVTGKPFSRLALSFLKDGDGPIHWLGAFVQGKRTLFFPGFTARFDQIEHSRGQQTVPSRKSFHFDHVSLESDKRTWHATASASSDHVGLPRTLDLGHDRVLWFGLSFNSLAVFRPAHATTTLEFSCPSRDVERRRNILVAARQGAEFPIISLNRATAGSPMPEAFFHVAVVAGPPGFPDYMGPELAFPIGSPYLRNL